MQNRKIVLIFGFIVENIKYQGENSHCLDAVVPANDARKLEVAFKPFKKGKASGPDGTDTEVLQNLDGVSLGRLALIYNVSLALGYVPERWRGGQSCPHPQGGKG